MALDGPGKVLADLCQELLRLRRRGAVQDPSREPIGIDRARAYVAWIKQHAGPVLEEAERMLHERYPGTETGRSSVTVKERTWWSYR